MVCDITRVVADLYSHLAPVVPACASTTPFTSSVLGCTELGQKHRRRGRPGEGKGFDSRGLHGASEEASRDEEVRMLALAVPSNNAVGFVIV